MNPKNGPDNRKGSVPVSSNWRHWFKIETSNPQIILLIALLTNLSSFELI
jgi:hypothetical protein